MVIGISKAHYVSTDIAEFLILMFIVLCIRQLQVFRLIANYALALRT